MPLSWYLISASDPRPSSDVRTGESIRSHSTTSPLSSVALMPRVRMSASAKRNFDASVPATSAAASRISAPMRKRLRLCFPSKRIISRRTCASVTRPMLLLI